MSPLEVGQQVFVERSSSWSGWVDEMNKAVGKIGVVVYVTSPGFVQLEVPGVSINWNYPREVLSPVIDPYEHVDLEATEDPYAD